ncbi:MAG: polyprenyl synthetase family protein [Deltaproteobacteria bacterium]|nr:polyprenyl synthetase family protein [Deltaproteobacteria bacterium]
MRIQEVFDLVKDDMKKVEEGFALGLNSRVSLVSKVGGHILNSGGKRFRPLVLLLCSRLCGYKGESHIPLAGVIEFIHTATLLHDDVVDNAHLRRGSVSANTIWGGGASILVGDYLLSKAFYLAVMNGNERILKVLAETTTRMAEGEVLQLLKHSDVETTEEEYLDVVTNKTAVLISAAARAAAILGSAGHEKEAALAGYGMGLGTAYQLMDDCLDYTSTDQDLGKSVGNDLREGKVTMPLIQAFKKGTQAERDFIRRAIEADGLPETALEEVIGIIEKHGGIGYTMDKAASCVEDAKRHLDIFAPDVEKMALAAVADFVVERTS